MTTPLRRTRSLPIALALTIGLASALVLSGCGSPTPTSPAAPENSPMVTAKDSMDYYKKTKNQPNKAPKR